MVSQATHISLNKVAPKKKQKAQFSQYKMFVKKLRLTNPLFMSQLPSKVAQALNAIVKTQNV
jgi:CRISPR/Cas system endoribonuclease Cas6 (RAMP superfamily)